MKNTAAKDRDQGYPSHPDAPTIDSSTGSVGNATTTGLEPPSLTATSATPEKPGRFTVLSDTELDEGTIWKPSQTARSPPLPDLPWAADPDRQSLDRVVPDSQFERLRNMFTAAGWQAPALN